ncbi:MAG: pyridoxal-phosphate dependent enzyme, partial [Gammaproteobacteria bacterium]
RAAELAAEGRKAYVIPLSNAHTPYGALGYVDAAEELLQQLNERQIEPVRFILPSGSASTHSGFLVGMRAGGCAAPIQGVCVRRDAASQKQRVTIKMRAVIDTLAARLSIGDDEVLCDDRMLPPGYGLPGEAAVEAIKYLAHRDGILLDPTYSGKTFAWLLEGLRRGDYAADDHVVFLHTGGAPSLFGYPELVAEG